MQESPASSGKPETSRAVPDREENGGSEAGPGSETDGDPETDWNLEPYLDRDPEADPGPDERLPARRPGAVQRRPAYPPLTPLERRQRRQTRQRMSVIAFVGVGLGVATLIAAIVAGRPTPAPRPTWVPAGFKAVNDGVYAYAVPEQWSTNQASTDDAGDRMTAGADGWVAEHIETRTIPLTAGATPPAPFESFGEPRPTPYTIGPATPTRVPRTTTAFRYEITRPGGFRATAVDAWSGPAQVQLWIFVHAAPAITATILSTLALG